MRQNDIDTAVARATGEELTEIRRRGFSIAALDELNFDPEPDNLPAQTIDWGERHFDRPTPAAVPVDEFLTRRSA